MHAILGIITLQGTKEAIDHPGPRHASQGFHGGTLEYDLALSFLSLLPMTLVNLFFQLSKS